MLVLHQEILVVQDWVELALGLHTFHELLYQIENLLRNLKTVAVGLIRKVTLGREHRQEILHIQLRKLSAYNQESLEKQELWSWLRIQLCQLVVQLALNVHLLQVAVHESTQSFSLLLRGLLDILLEQ